MVKSVLFVVSLFLYSIIIPSENPFISFPHDLVPAIMYRIPYKDQIFFKSTCKSLYAMPLYIKTLGSMSPEPKHSRASLYMYSTLTACSTCIYLGGYISPQLNSVVTEFSAATFGIFCAGGALMWMSPRICATLDNAHDRLTLYEQNRQKIAQTKQITSLQQSLAHYMLNHTCKIDELHIRHCAQHDDIAPLFKAARKNGIEAVTIDIETDYDPKPLKLSSLLAKNNSLKKLKIETRCKEWPKIIPLSLCSLSTGLKHNTHLYSVELHYLNLSPHLLDTLFSHNSIKALVLCGCATEKTYNFAALAKNTTLKKLALLYFINYDSPLNDSMVPIILTFMKNNKSLEDLTLRTLFLSNSAVTRLRTSPYAPKKLVVP